MNHTIKFRHYLLVLLTLLSAVSSQAQYRVNRQNICIEGGAFAMAAPVSDETFMYIPDFSLARGETAEVTVYLQSNVPIWMLQLHLQLPNGLSVSGVTFSSDFSDWAYPGNDNPNSLTWGMVGNELRIVTMNGDRVNAIPACPEPHGVFKLLVTADPSISMGTKTIVNNSFKFVAATSAAGTGYVGAKRDCHVTIFEAVTGISINQKTTVLYLNESTTLSCTVTPSNSTYTAVSWSSHDEDVATVDANGVVTAHQVGFATITATNNGTYDGAPLTDSCIVEVRAYATGITINKQEAHIYMGGNDQLSVTILPDNAFNKSATWRSTKPTVATVDSTGLVTAKSLGTVRIIATTCDGTNLSDTCNVTVWQQVTGMTINRSSAVLYIDDTLSLYCTVTPSNSTYTAVTWSSSDEDVASVDANGVVTAHQVGFATITATNNGTYDGTPLTDSCIVEVRAYATGIIINKQESQVYLGGTEQLTATVLPDNAYNKSVTWRSTNTYVATVNSTGLVTAKALGTARIIATTGDGTNLRDTCEVTVTGATDITLNKTNVSLYVGASETLSCQILPADLIVKDVTWRTSNSSVATVNSNGTVTAQRCGVAYITATTTDGTNLSATCQVTVTGATSIALNKAETTLYAGASETLTCQLLPADLIVKNVVWTTSNSSVATVNTYGKVTANRCGVAYITATTADGSNLSATCMVTVTGATRITLNKAETMLFVGDNETLTYQLLPNDLILTNVTWSSSDPSVASVNYYGTITALKRGETVITATTADGTYLSANCLVTVLPLYALEIEPLSHVRGAAPEMVEVPVNLINKNNISSLQFDVTLPHGVSMAMYDDEPDIWLNDARRSRNHSVNASLLTELDDEQIYRVLVSSPTNNALKDHYGPVLYMNLLLDQYHNAGDYSISFTNIVLNEPDETEHILNNYNQRVRLYYVLGDADADTHVDIADYTATALKILNRPTVRFYEDAANVNHDAVINVTDLTAITNIALALRPTELCYAPARHGLDSDALVTQEMEVAANITALSQCAISLHNTQPVAAMQMDLELPQGVTVSKATLAGRASDHQVDIATLPDGRVRLLISAFSDVDIAPGEDAVVVLELKGFTDGAIEFADIIATERDLTTHVMSNLVVPISTSGIGQTTNHDSVRIYAQDCDIIIESPCDGKALLSMLNGVTRELNVKAGHNCYSMEGGCYFVRINGVVAKLMLR